MKFSWVCKVSHRIYLNMTCSSGHAEGWIAGGQSPELAFWVSGPYPLHSPSSRRPGAPLTPGGMSASGFAQSSSSQKFLTSLPDVASEGFKFPLTVSPCLATFTHLWPAPIHQQCEDLLSSHWLVLALPLAVLGIVQKKRSPYIPWVCVGFPDSPIPKWNVRAHESTYTHFSNGYFPKAYPLIPNFSQLEGVGKCGSLKNISFFAAKHRHKFTCLFLFYRKG